MPGTVRLKPLGALAIALWLAACASTPPPPPAPLQALQGRWKTTDSTVTFSDGTKLTQSPPCWIEFTGQRSVTECHIAATVSRLVRINRELAPGRFESEVIENPSVPGNVGSRSRVDYRIEEGMLFTTAYPPAPKQEMRRYPVKIEATWVREQVPLKR